MNNTTNMITSTTIKFVKSGGAIIIIILSHHHHHRILHYYYIILPYKILNTFMVKGRGGKKGRQKLMKKGPWISGLDYAIRINLGYG